MKPAVKSRRPDPGPEPATTDPRGGQAILELMIGLVVVLVLVTALVQFTFLARADLKTMQKARELAGRDALASFGPGLGIGSDAEYIQNWQPGPDQRPYTADDTFTDGSLAAFQSALVERASPDSAGWDWIDSIRGNALSTLHNTADPATFLGLVKGESEETVEMISAVQHLLYAAPSARIQNTVWMTRMTDLQ